MVVHIDEEEGYIQQHLRSIMTEQPAKDPCRYCGLVSCDSAHQSYCTKRPPDAKFEGRQLLLSPPNFFAERLCGDCRRPLVKRDPSVTVVCPCGWGWR